MQRATVDLPEPDLADDAEGLAAPHLERDVLRRAHLAAAAQPAAAIDLGEPRGAQHGLRRGIARALVGGKARHRGDQHPRVVVARRGEHLARRADLDHAAPLHHRDAVGDLGDHAEVVGDEQHGGRVPALQVLDQPQDLRLGRDVERGRRLVGDQQHGLEHQRHRDHDRAGAGRPRADAGRRRRSPPARAAAPRS